MFQARTPAALPMPPAHRLRRAWRALKHSHHAHLALVLPESAPSFEEIPGLEQVIAWADELGRDITIVGGNPQVRAEAIVRGLRVSTDLAAWHIWVTAVLAQESQRAPAGAPHTWQVLRPEPHDPGDLQPDHILWLGAQVLLIATPDRLPAADEIYEDRVIALLWETSGLDRSPQAAV
jgi:hypothetical protein